MFPLKRKSTRFLAAGIATVVIGGGTFGIVSAASSGGSSAAATVPATTAGGGAHPGGFSGPSGSGGGGSNARSRPAAGGSIGTVSNVSGSGLTLTTSAGQKVTVKETSSTSYENGTSPASASALTNGETALVLGTTDNTTITASQVIVQPANAGSNTSSQVVPFKRGASSTSKTVGQIPSSYKQGSGTIVSGATANNATEAALAAYPGGIVDRVVQLSNGEYEVHNIGVNWPHHIFVNTNFNVVGAD
jgi:membrane-bound inhibitor of C-type lysozyme